MTTLPTAADALRAADALSPGFFLSSVNPIATADQIAVEAQAIALLATEPVQRARLQAATRFRIMAGDRLTAEAEARIDELLTEYCFCYALKAANGDANYPKVVAGLYGPGHDWFGLTVPGSRGAGGDGPDQNYSFMPIDYGGEFLLEGQSLAPAPADTTYTLTGSLGFTMTLGNIEGRDLIRDDQGRFAITLGPQPAAGDPNHLQTTPNARYLFVRECRADWRQVPAIHRVRRLNPPTMPPLSEAQITDRAAQFIVDDACAMFWLSAYMQALAPNQIGPVINSGAVGGLTTQRISFARILLAPDEAFVITVSGHDAPFRDIVVHDFWFRTFDYWRRTSNFNNAQTLLNADGSASYVIAARDPGVHNWLDTAGFIQLLLVHRWQGLPRDLADADGPRIAGRLVKQAELAALLPDARQWIGPVERQEQLRRRGTEFALRYALPPRHPELVSGSMQPASRQRRCRMDPETSSG